LQRVLCQYEVAKLADERRRDTTVFFTEGLFDLCGCGHPIPATLFL
jgi:hypothetical protein